MNDLVIRNGLVVDGTGAAPRHADVAITGGVITEVAPSLGAGHREIDADGQLVMPGIVDVHTHYDGQVTWDDELTPSSWHGVTTAVMGNCGVGFAPVRPDRHDWLIGLMEGVEDIPGAALSEGIEWEWEHYPDYLRALDRRRLVMDVGSLIPHGAVRAYVMGDRGAHNEAATTADIEAMAVIVADGLAAGALGFSTSRTIAHMAIDGEPVPGTFAAEAELFGIGAAMAQARTGIFELAPAGVLGEDLAAPRRELDWMVRLAAVTGRPVVFAMTQNDLAPDAWRELLDICAGAQAAGAAVHPQVAGRPVTILLGLQTFHPFAFCPSWSEVALLDVAVRAHRLADEAFRARLLDEVRALDASTMQFVDPERTFVMTDPPNYEPDRSTSIAARARARGVDVMVEYLDCLAIDEGRQLLMRPLLNYSNFSLDDVREMLDHPATVWGLGDGGAHCSTTCDGSTPSFMLSHWVRDRPHHRLPLEQIVRTMTRDTATLFGLSDRGALLPGLLGDVAIVDLDGLTVAPPEMVNDLPAGGRRFVQRASGWSSVIKRGEVTYMDGEATGARPGGLVRGAR